jgi:hypothetical protein
MYFYSWLKQQKLEELFDICGKGGNGSNLAPLKVAYYVTHLLRLFLVLTALYKNH